MKLKTNELTGRALNWVVGACEKRGYREYSTDWALGGPIIEREHIDLEWKVQHWDAFLNGVSLHDKTAWSVGPTPLIAAMRCYVASQLGDEVDVPDELV